MTKRILAMFLVVCMVSAMVPFTFINASADPLTADPIYITIDISNQYTSEDATKTIAWATTDSSLSVEDLYGQSANGDTFQWFYKIYLVYNETENGLVVTDLELPGEGATRYDSWKLGEGKIVIMNYVGSTDENDMIVYDRIAIGDLFRAPSENEMARIYASGHCGVMLTQIGENVKITRSAAIDLDIVWPSHSSHVSPYDQTYVFADSSAQYSVGGFYTDSTNGDFPGTNVPYWHKVLFTYNEDTDKFVVTQIESAGEGKTEYASWKAGLNNLVVIAYNTAPCYEDLVSLEIGDELYLTGATFAEIQQGNGSPDQTLDGVQLILETEEEVAPPTALPKEFGFWISTTRCYDADGIINVRVELNSIWLTDGLSGVGFTLKYDSEKFTLINDLDEENDNALDCIASQPNADWENLSNVKHVINENGEAVPVNDGIINVIALTVSTDPSHFANEHNLCFTFSFKANADATGDTDFEILDDGILGMQNTADSFVKVSGNGTTKTVHSHYCSTVADCVTEQRCDHCLMLFAPALGHSFTNYISNNDATCTANGTETAICDRCDATDTREDDDSALGHTAGTEATCTEAQVCTVCGEILAEALGHTAGAEATCTEDQVCTVCGEVLAEALGHNYGDEQKYDEINHWYECQNCGDVTGVASHIFEKDTCSCGYTREHVHTPDVAEPTCTKAQVCTVCGEILAEALGHTAGAEATCTEDQVCTVCGEVLAEALGHTAGAEATCTEDQVCTVCGEVLAEALGHTAGAEATCTEDQVCTVCGEVLAEALGHTAGAEATCTEDQVCTVCNEVLAEALGHTAGAEATCTEDQVCTVCGEVLAEALGHTAGAEATCTEDQVCTVCGEVLAEALGHIAGAEATCTEDQVCTVCGEVLAEALGHTAGAEATCTEDQVCTVCGEILAEALGHTEGEWQIVKEAEVGVAGLREKRCTVCDELLASEEIPAIEIAIVLGDVSGNGAIDVADYTMIRRHVMGNYVLQGDALIKGDVDKDGKITFVDYVAIKRHVMGTYVILDK